MLGLLNASSYSTVGIVASERAEEVNWLCSTSRVL